MQTAQIYFFITKSRLSWKLFILAYQDFIKKLNPDPRKDITNDIRKLFIEFKVYFKYLYNIIHCGLTLWNNVGRKIRSKPGMPTHIRLWRGSRWFWVGQLPLYVPRTRFPCNPNHSPPTFWLNMKSSSHTPAVETASEYNSPPNSPLKSSFRRYISHNLLRKYFYSFKVTVLELVYR